MAILTAHSSVYGLIPINLRGSRSDVGNITRYNIVISYDSGHDEVDVQMFLLLYHNILLAIGKRFSGSVVLVIRYPHNTTTE